MHASTVADLSEHTRRQPREGRGDEGHGDGPGARIVAVNSVGHINGNGNGDFDDLNFDRRPFDPWLA